MGNQNKHKVILVLAILAGTVLLGYQNCSPAPGQKLQFPSEGDLSGSAPFAYDVEADTYAYMSCSDRPELDKNVYFTVKLGALYSGSGVSLSLPFTNFAQNNNLDTARVKQILSENTFAGGAKVQVSLRATSSLRGNPLGTGPFPGRVTTSFGSLSEEPLVTSIAQSDISNRVRSSLGMPLVGSFLISASSEAGIQDAISNSGIAIIGFQGAFFSDPSQNEFRIIAPFDTEGAGVNAVYGRGYDPTFDAPIFSGSKITMHGQRILGTLTEKQVADGSMATMASWNCRSQAQYRIVPYADRFNANCSTTATNTGLTGDDLRAYQSAKALLIDTAIDPNRWRIDQARRCIVDMQSSMAVNHCYDMNKGAIQWGLTPTDTCGGATGRQCPQYLSICWR